MSTITTAAARWPALVAERETLPNPNGPSATTARAKTNADWPALRTRIFDAIASIQQELSTVTVGTEGSASFGRFELTTRVIRTGTSGIIEDIQVSLKCTSTPPLNGLGRILVTDNYRVQMGPPIGDLSVGLKREYDIGELLAGVANQCVDVNTAVRWAVSAMMP